MQNTPQREFARAKADALIAQRFKAPYGVSTLDEYLEYLDRRTTAHLAPHLASRVHRTAGAQRRKASQIIADNGSLLHKIPMNDPRTGQTVYAVTEFHIWLDVLESGADGAWVYNHKSSHHRVGQVCVKVPLGMGRLAAIARIIANAKHGQQARLHDHNPFNLCRENVYLIGNPKGPEGRVGRAKTDTRAEAQKAAELRAKLAGRNYDHGGDESE
ncbi:hypothetical protein ACLGGT_16175 [Roseovarius sp. MS2]|uniref:hypothetical protein n=1 Tax=Roseovarius sp. MS2 TaxID=3390728 RepID=UPI003EDBE432